MLGGACKGYRSASQAATAREEARRGEHPGDYLCRYAALDQLAGVNDADARRLRINARLRAAFLEGAEAESRRRLGRGLTPEEIERVLLRYLGDLATEPAVQDNQP